METRANNAAVVVWWIIWMVILSGLFVMQLVLGEKFEGNAAPGSRVAYISLVPLLFSSLLRWLVLPKQRDAAKALVIFILGVATAESCGIIGIFLGGENRTTFFVLGMFGVVQWIPLFARRFYEPAAGDAHGLRSR